MLQAKSVVVTEVPGPIENLQVSKKVPPSMYGMCSGCRNAKQLKANTLWQSHIYGIGSMSHKQDDG